MGGAIHRTEKGSLGESAADKVAESYVDALRMPLPREGNALKDLRSLGGNWRQEKCKQGWADLFLKKNKEHDSPRDKQKGKRKVQHTSRAAAVATTAWMKGFEKRKIIMPPTQRWITPFIVDASSSSSSTRVLKLSSALLQHKSKWAYSSLQCRPQTCPLLDAAVRLPAVSRPESRDSTVCPSPHSRG